MTIFIRIRPFRVWNTPVDLSTCARLVTRTGLKVINWHVSEAGYTYDSRLDRVYKVLRLTITIEKPLSQ